MEDHVKKILIIGLSGIVAISAMLAISTKLVASIPCEYSITANPASLDFGNQAAGTDTGSRTVTIRNSSILWAGPCNELTVGVSLAGPGAGQFVIDSENCTTLALGAECTANIVFSPDAEGAFTGSFEVSGTGPAAVSDSTILTGNGTPFGSIDEATTLLLSMLKTSDGSDGCNANASTGAAGTRSSGPAAMGLIALMGLVLGAVTVRRRMRKRS